MKNIHEILKELGIEIPADKKADFDTAVNENYKTVAEVDKIRTLRKSELFLMISPNLPRDRS